MTYAPIILFAYNRPEFVRQTLNSLSENLLADKSDLFIYCDGPKADASESELTKINEVRKAVREKKWCRSVNVIESPVNKGLARSVTDGVSEIVRNYGKVIVVEDDVLLSKYFLQFMNDSLEMYKDDNDVLSIGSWSYFTTPGQLSDETYFFRFPDSIAWATFERSWALFEADAKKLMYELKSKNKLNDYNAGLKFPYFSNMLQAQIDGKVNSWAIRWTAVAILSGKLSLFPSVSLSKHIGFAADATHEKNSKDYNKDLQLSERKINVDRTVVVENRVALQEWRQFYLRNFIPVESWQTSARTSLKKLIPDALVEVYRKMRYGKK